MNNKKGGFGAAFFSAAAWLVMAGIAFIVLGLVFLGCREVFEAIVN